jgi:hypothetical protein
LQRIKARRKKQGKKEEEEEEEEEERPLNRLSGETWPARPA